MITAKINVTRILKEHLYQGKNGKYLDLVIWANKNGTDQYGNTHTVCQSVSKEARESGINGPIIGNLKLDQPVKPSPARAPATQASPEPENYENHN